MSLVGSLARKSFVRSLRAPAATKEARRRLGDGVSGPPITNIEANWKIAQGFFTKTPVSYTEYKQQCMSLRLFAFAGVTSGCLLGLIVDPPKSSYWHQWSPAVLASNVKSAFFPGDTKPMFLTQKEGREDALGMAKKLMSTRRTVAAAPAVEPAAPADEPAAAPVEAPAEAPAKVPVKAPAEAPAAAPVKAPVEAPAAAPADRLFGKKPGIDPEYDLIMDESLAKNEYPTEKMEAADAAKHKSLAAKFCTPEMWEKYKDTESSGPAKWTMARAINSGVMHPDSFVGCHAGDRESYDDFKDFFYPLIEAYHKGFSMVAGSDLEGTASERMDPEKIATQLSDSAQSKIVSTRIRVARNLAAFPLNPGGTRESREAIANLMTKVYAGLENDALKGEFFLHSTMSDEQRQALIDGHQLFRGKDRMQAASGYHQYWPHGRGVFHNPEKSFVNWVNEGDHLRIISMQNGGDVKAVFSRLSEGAEAIESGVRKTLGTPEGEEIFMMHPKFGSVTCCPSNIGTGMRGSVHILVPKLIKTMGFDAIDALARDRNCQARGSSGEHSEVVDRIDISNWRRIGLPEYELVNDMIKCVNFLAEEEDKLA